jgi:hypothetical protein
MFTYACAALRLPFCYIHPTTTGVEEGVGYQQAGTADLWSLREGPNGRGWESDRLDLQIPALVEHLGTGEEAGVQVQLGVA